LAQDKELFHRVKENSLLVSWLFLVPPGLILVIFFLIENAQQIYFREALRDGPLCKVCAFVAILTLTALNGSATTTAYLTYFCVRNGKKPPIKFALIGNLISWLIGLAFSFVYLFGNVYGPYRGIYCCVKQEFFKGLMVAEEFIVLGISVAVQTFLYTRCYFESSKHSAGSSHINTAAIALMKRGLEMISVFYFSYVLVAVDAVAIFANPHTSIWLSVLAAWLVKLEPFFHCLLLHRIFNRMQKRRAQVYPLTGQRATSDNRTITRIYHVLQWLHSNARVPSQKYAQVPKKRKKASMDKDMKEIDEKSIEK